MKIQFEADLDYQIQAVDAVCDLFRGQEICRTEFTVTKSAVGGAFLPGHEDDQGVGNRLTLLDDQILANLRRVQLRNGLPPSEALGSFDFTVEMETGTGKTYVYLRTIFELHRLYGFTKFVVVVPSVAIKEGVYKTLQMTEEHFRARYANVPFEYFLYDSSKLGQVRNFATSPHIQVMVATVGAINKKDVNNLYKDNEKTGGEKPIDLVRATRPILIVDEPQSVDGGLEGRGKEALGAMGPLCTLRYSATHADKYNMVYRLDAVDAYRRELVKQIEVASATIEDGQNRPYVRLLDASSKRNAIRATVELDVETAAGVRRQSVVVQTGDDLEQTTKRAVYHDCSVGEIAVGKGRELLELRTPGESVYLRPGEAHGDANALAVQRAMIRRTIKEHLDKEKRLRPRGIKVLSLFFVDAVEKYRKYDRDGNQEKGEYALVFEEEYRRLAAHPDYRTLFDGVDLSRSAEEVHGGYFSIDRRRVGGKTVEVFKDTRGDSKADDDTYNLIMRDKERLLSLDTPLKFLFSHSALREGWDNPNVFQICALRDIRTERERRQTVGRGLRLCVGQDGVRRHGFDVNTLTVVATERYEEFAENLQREIEAETGIRFGVVEPDAFAAIPVPAPGGEPQPFGLDNSRVVWEALQAAGLIDRRGRVQDALRTALLNDTVELPAAFAAQRPQIVETLRKLAGRLEVKNADERRTVRPREAVIESADFKALWDRIKAKTTYRVEFDNERLVADCAAALRKAPAVNRTVLRWRKAQLEIGLGGVEAKPGVESAPMALTDDEIDLPDLLTELQDRTQLTRGSIRRILEGSGRLADFPLNPQQFIAQAAKAINDCKQLAIVDGIKYRKIGEFYSQERFLSEELTAYLKKNLLPNAAKSAYEQVVYDSEVERRFAEELERTEGVKVYAKLPGWFTVPTPLGDYNPDWAVLVEREDQERLYLVVETKGSLFLDDLRARESAKIHCGEAHFRELRDGEDGAQYCVATTLTDVLKEA